MVNKNTDEEDKIKTNKDSTSIQLGSKPNINQFVLLIIVNAFVGAMIGLEQTVIPILGQDIFDLESNALILSFIASFGIVKAILNLFAGSLSDKFAKEKMVIELHKQGKTIRQIAPEVHMSFRDIAKIIKAYERKAKRKESNKSTQPKKPSISTQAFKLFKDGKKLTDVAIDLEIPARKTLKLFSQFLRLERMYECYEFYQVFQYQIPQLLAISTFIKMNKVNISNIPNILRTATDVNTLNETYYQLKTEVRSLEDKKINLSYYSHSGYSLQPLPFNKPNNNYYRY